MSSFDSGISTAGKNHQLFTSNIRSTTANSIKVSCSQIAESAANELQFVNSKSEVGNGITTVQGAIVNKDISTGTASEQICTDATVESICTATATDNISTGTTVQNISKGRTCNVIYTVIPDEQYRAAEIVTAGAGTEVVKGDGISIVRSI